MEDNERKVDELREAELGATLLEGTLDVVGILEAPYLDSINSGPTGLNVALDALDSATL